MIPGVDYPVYSYAGKSFPSKRLFHGICKWCARANETRRKIQQIVLLTLSLRRQQMRPIIHSSLKVEKDATTVELAAQASG